MKRIISLILAAVLVLVLFPANTAFAAENFIIRGTDTTTEAGENVTVDIVLENNPGFCAINLYYTFDTNYFTLTEVENKIADFTMTHVTTTVWDAVSDLAEDTTLGTLHFNVAENTPAGEYEIEIRFLSAANGAFEEVTAQTVSATVTVKEKSCAHGSRIEVPCRAADCENPGNNQYFVCEECGVAIKADGITETTTEQEIIPALGHKMTEGTCTEAAVCQRVGCGYVGQAALGHNFVAGVCTRCGVDENASGPQIVSQPVDFVGMVGDTATFTVTAEGEGLKYQWYFYDAAASEWKKSSGTNATLNVEFKAYRNNQQYRCEITDSDGNTVITDVVKIVAQAVDLVIVTQPVDYVGSVNDELSFTVEATGNGLTYQWYYSSDGGTSWVKSGTPGFDTNNLRPILRAYRDGYQFRCVVTDVLGNSITSDTVSMTVKSSDIVIMTQPTDVEEAILGELYYYTVEATGDNLTYRWEVSSDGGVTWNESWNQGYDTATLGVRMNANRDGNLYRCVITSGLKIVATTNAVILDMQDPSAAIVSSPSNQYVTANKTCAFKVQATGTDLTYQWYRSNDKGATWNVTYLSGYNTDTLSFVATAGRAAMYKCKITDGSGYAVWSGEAKLQILSAELKLLTQPADMICASGETATFTVEAQGDTLKYQWYASSDGGATWTASYMTGYNTAEFSFVVNATRAAKLYKCVITDIAGNTVESDAVSVTIG